MSFTYSLRSPDQIQTSSAGATDSSTSSPSSGSGNAPSYRVMAVNELSQNKTYVDRNQAGIGKAPASSPYTALGTAGSTFMGHTGGYDDNK